MGNNIEPGKQSDPTTTRRRVLFPWILLGILASVLMGSSLARIDTDVLSFIWFVAILLTVILIGIWYLIRGRGPLWLRLGVAAAPFLFLYVFPILFEFEHDGDVRIVGISWRGQANPDELLAPLVVSPNLLEEAAVAVEPIEVQPTDYARFLGDGYWPEVSGIQLASNWEENPPQEIWRQPIGAGWSSFAIVGNYAFTQEQRGSKELVVCYETQTGKPLWTHEDDTRFDPDGLIQSMGGRGPRATPTVGNGIVLTHGASGIINCLDARTGEIRWSVNAPEKFGCAPLTWGNSSSPLLVPATETDKPMVLVAIGAPYQVAEGNYDSSLVAFDLATGEVRWQAGWRETSYASPIVTDLHGIPTVVQVNQDFVTGYALADGKVLWEHPFPGRSDADANSTQAVPVGNNQILLSKGYGYGASLVQISLTEGAWSTDPVWSPAVQKVLKTKLSNLVIRDGYAYGLSAGLLECVEVATGNRQWKKRRRPAIGHGQLLLVGEHMLITSESGELILFRPSPEQYEELATIRILSEDAICWSNPAVVGDLLLVRNSEEAVAYRLPLATGQ